VIEQIVSTVAILTLNVSLYLFLFSKKVVWERLILIIGSYLILFLVFTFNLIPKHCSAQDKTELLLIPIMLLGLKIFLLVWIPLSKNPNPFGEPSERYMSLIYYYNFVWTVIITKIILLAISYYQMTLIWGF
jgi:hypothetical protein